MKQTRNGLSAELNFATPLWLLEHAGRQSHNSLDKFAGDSPNENADFIVKTGHDALLKMGDLHYTLTMSRSILLEFEKHIIGVCTPENMPADINKSTRYTLKELLKLIKGFINEAEDSYSNSMDDLIKFISNNIRDKGMTASYAATLIEKYSQGCTTPDTIKEALPESWLVTGDYKISYLAMKNIIKQRHQGTTGKPHFLIQELVDLMINCLDDNRKRILGVNNA